MIVENELLGYPKYLIYQDPECFSFSIDSLMLAHFATITKKTSKIIDLCTGNAPIPLYLTLRTKKPIIGIEIQKYSYELATKSVEVNMKEEQISIICGDVKGINKQVGCQKFDLVTCNPPYFKYKEDSNTNKSDAKKIARHEIMLNLDDVCKEASLLLNNGGYFAMVHRPERFVEIIECLKKHHLEPKRIQFIYPKKDSEANHLLIEAKKCGLPGLKILKPLIIYEDNHKWTKDILEIYNFKGE